MNGKSLVEILIKIASHRKSDSPVLNLIEVGYGGRFNLSPLSPKHITMLAKMTPNLTVIRLKAKDKVLPLLAMFPNLLNITVTFIGCLGEGFIKLLEDKGGST